MSEASDFLTYWQGVNLGKVKPIGPGGGGAPVAPQLGRPPAFIAQHVAAVGPVSPPAPSSALDSVAGWLSMRSLFGLPRWAVIGAAGVLGYYFAKGGKR